MLEAEEKCKPGEKSQGMERIHGAEMHQFQPYFLNPLDS